MSYNQKFAAAICVNDQPLRDTNGEVYIPFGAEYSVLLKNLNNLAASVTVTIDGKSISSGSVIVRPFETVNLERFIEDMNTGNRFKYIERTAEIEQHRGVRVDDGLVVIKYQYEKPPVPNNTFFNNNPTVVSNWWHSNAVPCTYNTNSTQLLNRDAGITVPGSISEQKFQTVSGLVLNPDVYSIVFSLKPSTTQVPITTKTRISCPTCGRTHKSDVRFCPNCGTYLPR